MESVSGRTPVQVVEIEQDQCALVYGESPCTATLSALTPDKCYNTRATCQDPQNYQLDAPLVLRFVRAQENIPFEWAAIPSLRDVSTIPTEINPGGGDDDKSPLGSRARVNITFTDHPYSDSHVDKYRAERLTGEARFAGNQQGVLLAEGEWDDDGEWDDGQTWNDAEPTSFDPLDRGTFWSKWLARNPFYTGRLLRIREGYLGQDLSEMVTRNYVITEIGGPSADGQVTVRADDILTLADPEKAQAPFVTEGELVTDISETADSLTITRFQNVDDYPAPGSFDEGFGTVRIGDEVIRYTQRSIDDDEITLSGLTRGADGTEADDHSAEDQVQLCLRYTNVPVWIVARDLLETYAEVPDQFIPFDDWQAEAEFWLSQFTVTTLITEPEGVADLLGEITQQCLFFIWWDERAQEIRLKALRPPVEDPKIITDRQNIIAGSWSVKTDLDQRLSQVWVYYRQRNPTESLDEPSNFDRLRIRIDTDAESDQQYDEKRVKRIFSRWLETPAQAINVTARLLTRYRDGAKYLRLRMDAKDRELWTGDVADVSLWAQVDSVGNPRTTRYQVISAEEVQPGEVVEYNLLTYEFVGRFAFWMDETAPVFTEASQEQRNFGGFWSDEDGLMSDGSEGWRWQ